MISGARIPRVSLGLPVYNGENYLAEAILSILAQDFPDFELIIVDNASTDDTAKICADFAARDARIRYVRNERNLGAAANFNRAFQCGRAAYFKWCAHDDLQSAAFLTETVEILDNNPDCVIAYPRLEQIDQIGQPTGYVWPAMPDMQDMNAASRFALLVTTPGWDAATFGLWRRDAAAQSSLHASYYGSDCALLAEMSLFGTFIPAPTATVFNRDHPQRSVRLHQSERIAWQNPQDGKRSSLELSHRIAHLTRIAWRHRDLAPFRRTAATLLKWTLGPRRLGRLFLECIGYISPRTRNTLRYVATRTRRWHDTANHQAST